MPDQPAYVQQWERVNRWYKRFEETSEHKDISESTSSDEDDVYAFFSQLLQSERLDPLAGPMRETVEAFINKSEALSICADLCNGLKHLSLDRPSRSGKEPRFGDKTSRVFFHTSPPRVCRGYTIVTDNGTFDAFDVAWQCVMDWWKYIVENPSKPKGTPCNESPASAAYSSKQTM